MAAFSGRWLEDQLVDSGNKLLINPPSSIDELLLLLDKAESFLINVEQSPPKSMHHALSPLTKALVGDELLRHNSDVDVKVALASCLTQILRITAPDAPYDDENMKIVFQLIVSSFENLYDESSRSLNKRIKILETVSQVRLCVVMLDLECHGLISDMFHHFLKGIREYHPHNIYSSMEAIMILVLEESEEISMDLVTKLLDSVENKNGEIKPIGQRLAESVCEKCAVKLKPYITPALVAPPRSKLMRTRRITQNAIQTMLTKVYNAFMKKNKRLREEDEDEEDENKRLREEDEDEEDEEAEMDAAGPSGSVPQLVLDELRAFKQSHAEQWEKQTEKWGEFDRRLTVLEEDVRAIRRDMGGRGHSHSSPTL